MSLRRKKYWLLLHLKIDFSYQSYAYYEVELSDIKKKRKKTINKERTGTSIQLPLL